MTLPLVKQRSVLHCVTNGNPSDITTLQADETSHSLAVNLRVWDSDTLAWVRMTKNMINLEFGGDLDVSFGDVEKLLIGSYFPNTKMDYDASDNCIYKGSNTDLSAADADTDWYIFKYDYSGGNCTQIRFRKTSWTDRAAGW